MADDRVKLIGSAPFAITEPHATSALDPSARIVVTLELRRREEPPKPGALISMRRQDFVQRHGASPSDLTRVRDFAVKSGLTVVEESAAKRVVIVAGSAQQIGQAFGIRPLQVKAGNRTFRHYEGDITIPAGLNGVVLAVLGLSERPVAKPRYRRFDRDAKTGKPSAGKRAAKPAAAKAFFANQVAALYHFPPGDGSGQTVAIVELGGGVGTSDLLTYFQSIGISAPTVTPVGVAGGSSQPGQDPDSDGEVMLDVEVLGTVAPRAKQFVYFAPNTDAGFLAAVQAAIHNTSPAPAAVSISWGGPESNWTPQAMAAMDRAFQDGAALGIPVCIASGDNGSTDGTNSVVVDFPASAPHALGCGGTHLEGSGSTITSEVVWNQGGGASGGGFSGNFARPSYQVGVPGSARGVPDVAGDADPATGYNVRVDGQNTVIGGTSAVAPLWAGLSAILAQQLKRSVGFLNPIIYQPAVASSGFRDITSGNNDVGNGGGKYSASPGWDPCTGLGTPNGVALLKALQSAAPKPPSPKPPGPKPPGPKPPGPKPPGPKPPVPKPPGPGTGGTGATGATGARGVIRSAWVPSPTYPVPPVPPPPLPLGEIAQRAVSTLVRSPALGIVAVVGLVVLGTVGVVALSEGGSQASGRQ